jgi:hypothetical protein
VSFGADGDDGKVLPVARSFITQELTMAGRGPNDFVRIPLTPTAASVS